MVSIQKRLLAVAVALAFVPALALGANSPEKCRRTVVKEAQKYGQKRANNLRKCYDKQLKGKVSSCPDAKTTDKNAKALSKALAKIEKKCEGLAVADTGFTGTTCPRAACAAPLGTIADVATCVTCNVQEMTDDLIEQTYGVLEAAIDKKADKDGLNCQRTWGKEAIKAYRKISKQQAKCQDALIKGKEASCPSTKQTEKTVKFQGKLDAKLAKKCETAAIQERALELGQAFGAVGGVDGLGERMADFGNAQVLFSSQSAVCGNAAIDPGETCDDGNVSGDTGVGPADPCPADCTISGCIATGSSVATVTFASPGGEDIASMTVLIYYNDVNVEIPGAGNNATVQAAVSPAGPFTGVTPNDTNYSLRAVLLDATLTGASSGDALTFDYNDCGGVISPADFDCFVVDASDNTFAAVDGVTCTVTP